MGEYGVELSVRPKTCCTAVHLMSIVVDHAVNQIFEVEREKTNLVNDAVKCHHHSTATDNVVCHGAKWSFSPPLRSFDQKN